MNIYTTDLRKLAMQWLPIALRTRLMVAFATLMQRGGLVLQKQLVQHRSESIYRLTHNSQVCYLRKVLNDKFDNDQRRIRIHDVDSKVAATIYARGDERTFMISSEPYLLSRRGFGGPSGFDFSVQVPIALTDDQLAQMEALINTYKLASKRYVI